MDLTAIGKEWGGVLAFVGAYAVLFIVSKFLKNILTNYNLLKELGEKDNFAVGISMGGYFLATAIIYVGVVTGPSKGLAEDLKLVFLYSLLGLVFLNVTRWCLDKIIFSQYCNDTQIVEDQNCGMAAVRFGAYVATGLIAAGSLHGQGGGIETSVVFFILGQAALFIFARIYDFTTPHHLQRQVRDGNIAAGMAFGGTLAALGIIIGKSISGEFSGWTESLVSFAGSAIIGIILLQIARMLMNRVVLAGHDLNKEISEDRNMAAGFLEMAVAVCFALVLAALI